MSPRLRLRALLAAAGVAGAVAGGARRAEATWSIILIDTRTGEVAIGSATCLTGFDLQANTPVMLTGIGGATAQSFVDSTGQNRVFIRDQLLIGTAPSQILTMLASFDSGHQTRQYGIADAWGTGHTATFSGTGDGQWAGGVTGRLVGAGSTGGDVIYAIQGNVLTGPPVVFAAEEEIAQTRGDLAERLMRGMEAARMFGGDGRCSCSPNNPTGCGSPPPSFIRSAYIAYMIIARAGDRDGCNGIYRTGAAPNFVFVSDLDLDGRPDLLTVNTSAANLSVSRNTTSRGVPTFMAVPANFAAGTSPRDIAAANLNADNFPDVVTANFTNNNVSVLRGQGNGNLFSRINYTVGTGPVALVLADFNGDGITDVATANSTAGTVSVLPNDGTAVLGAAVTVTAGTGPTSIDAADLDGDGDVDLVVGLGTGNAVVVLRNTTPAGGAISFVADPPIPTGRGVNGVKIARLDGDGRPDIVASAATDHALNVLLQTDSGFSVSTIALGPTFLNPSGVTAGDVNGDGFLDLVTTSRGSPARLVKVMGHGDGTFDAPVGYLITATPGRPTLADLNGDGDLDAVFPMSNNASAMVVENLGGGVFNSGIGCATGDYWMDFNITTTDPNAPDPVFGLRARFDEWRGDLAGRPDAVITTALFDHASIVGNGTATATMTITPRDFSGAAATAPIQSVAVTHAPGSAGLSTIGTPVNNGDGTWSVVVTAGNDIGTDRFSVRIDDGARAVVLMPSPSLVLTINADWNHDGVVNSADYFAFVNDFLAQIPADINQDGVTNSQDYFDFLTAFFG